MMRVLKISPELSLPIDAVTQTFLVVGKRGSGKSNTAARLVEQLHRAGIPFVVLDPTDTWWGLKAGRDGGPGLGVYVFGGRKADLPLNPDKGAELAEVLCEHRVSMVLSVKHLSGRERSGFMVAFAQTLFQKWNSGPLHVVLEEAHELAPQGVQNSKEGEQQMLGAFKRLWKLGRSSGIGGTAVTQRPASLSKDITTQSEVLIAHRTIGPQDVKAIGEWVKYHGQHESILGDLPTLPTGQAFIWAPEFPSDKPIGLQRVSVLLRETYDSASTPKVGEERREPKELTPVDLKRLEEKMAATIKRAKAEDPKELRKQIAELRSALALRVEAEKRPAKSTTKAIDVRPFEARIKKLSAALERLMKFVIEINAQDFFKAGGETIDQAKIEQAITAAVQQATKVLDVGLERRRVALERWRLEGQRILKSVQQIANEEEVKVTLTVRQNEPFTVAPTTPRQPVAHADAGVSGVQQRILDALAELEALGADEPPRPLVALLAGYTNLGSKGFVNAASELSTAGLVEYRNGAIVATAQGRAAARPVEAPQTAEEVQERVCKILGGASERILRPLIEVYPNAMPRQDLAARAGYGNIGSKGFVNAVSRLSTLGFIRYEGKGGGIVAQPVLFLEGAGR